MFATYQMLIMTLIGLLPGSKREKKNKSLSQAKFLDKISCNPHLQGYNDLPAEHF